MAREGDAAARSCEYPSAGLGGEPPRPSTGAAPEDLHVSTARQSSYLRRVQGGARPVGARGRHGVPSSKTGEPRRRAARKALASRGATAPPRGPSQPRRAAHASAGHNSLDSAGAQPAGALLGDGDGADQRSAESGVARRRPTRALSWLRPCSATATATATGAPTSRRGQTLRALGPLAHRSTTGAPTSRLGQTLRALGPLARRSATGAPTSRRRQTLRALGPLARRSPTVAPPPGSVRSPRRPNARAGSAAQHTFSANASGRGESPIRFAVIVVASAPNNRIIADTYIQNSNTTNDPAAPYADPTD